MQPGGRNSVGRNSAAGGRNSAAALPITQANDVPYHAVDCHSASVSVSRCNPLAWSAKGFDEPLVEDWREARLEHRLEQLEEGAGRGIEEKCVRTCIPHTSNENAGVQRE